MCEQIGKILQQQFWINVLLSKLKKYFNNNLFHLARSGVYLHFLYNYNLHKLGGNTIARTFSGLSFHLSSVKLKLSQKKDSVKKQSEINIQTSDNDFPKL